MDGLGEKPRLAALLEHFAEIEDDREVWRVAHPLPEVLLLTVCATIASCDDFDDIVAWGETHIGFLRRFLPFEHGVPGARWLNILMNRIDAATFSACFMSWARTLRPDADDLAALAGKGAPARQIAIDGKTSRRSHDRSGGHPALHLVSAFATRENLVLGQQACADHAGEIVTIPLLLQRLAASGQLEGALVSIDAIACNPDIAEAIRGHRADYVLAVKDNQPGHKGELARFFADPGEAPVETHVDVDKGHGRIEERRTRVSAAIDWIDGDRRFPGEARFAGLRLIAEVHSRVEEKGQVRNQTRYFIASRVLSAEAFGAAVRNHWRIENALHWVLDVAFRDDLSRVRKGHGATNMAVVRHFAINIVRTATDRKSIKIRRKLAGWSPEYLENLISPPRR